MLQKLNTQSLLRQSPWLLLPIGFGLTAWGWQQLADQVTPIAELFAYAGIITTLFLTLVVWLLLNGHHRVKHYANEMNHQLLRNKQALKKSEAQLRAVLNASEVGMMWINQQNLIEYVNPKFVQLFAYSREQIPSVDQWYLFAFPDSTYRVKVVNQWQQQIEASSPNKTPLTPMEVIITARDGSRRPIQMMASWAQDRLLVFFSDVSQQKQTENQLRTLSTAVEQSPASVIITNLDANIEYVNPRFTQVTGYSAEEVLGLNPRFLKSGKTDPAIYDSMWANLVAGQTWHGELLNVRKNGDLYWEETHIAPVKDERGIATHYVAVKLDITARKTGEQLIRELAHHDQLTGLPNRVLFSDRLKQALSIARRDQKAMAIIFIDLDKFKPVNDLLGHQVGDLLLMEVANRMLQMVRESDTVARIGGDEFVVLLPYIEQASDAQLVAEKIRHALATPFEIQGQQLDISCSLGIACYPEHGNDEQQLVHHADMAMYQAKNAGRNCIILFDHNLAEAGEIKHSLKPA